MKLLKFSNLFFIILSLFLTSCSLVSRIDYKKLSRYDKNINGKYLGHFKYVKEDSLCAKITDYYKFNQVGIASWYGTDKAFHNQVTANGDLFNMNCLSCAHRKLPIPSMIRVTNLSNNKSVILMVNDRGPYKHNRILDVSAKAAELLGFKHKGITTVKLEFLEKETKELLKKINLPPVHGARPKIPMFNNKCSVNCFIQELNIKSGYLDKGGY